MIAKTPILRVAVPSPLYKLFDYLPPETGATSPALVGARVLVPFGRRQIVGIVCASSTRSFVDPQRLKRIVRTLDDEPLLSADMLKLLNWTCRYYHAQPGEGLFAGLPTLLRRKTVIVLRQPACWELTTAGTNTNLEVLARAPRQRVLVEYLRQAGKPVSTTELSQAFDFDWRAALQRLQQRQWVLSRPRAEHLTTPTASSNERLELHASQRKAVDQILASIDQYRPFLLEGVTGSGKTEVYLQVIERVLERGRQALILVPEIGLTPQLISRFRRRFAVPINLYHSNCSDSQRLETWFKARDGATSIIIGTRSAVFVPLRHPGIIILDEEHDASFKQQDGMHYHARDVAVKRAQLQGIPIVLGSATPSMETVHNARQGRYAHLELRERMGGAVHPRVQVIDTRKYRLTDGMSRPMIDGVARHLDNGNQVLIYLNRRGFAPTVLCRSCGWICRCNRCDANMVLHRSSGSMYCHHCGYERPSIETCPQCGSAEVHGIGQGTQRLEEMLTDRFGGYGVVRIDRDTTRRRGSFEALMEQVCAGEKRLLIGTQMLAKGHHLPLLTLVCVVDCDQGLFSIDFRAAERLAQQIIQVSGRAGRTGKLGEVLIQTHFPDHPLLQALLDRGYRGFADDALEERCTTRLPPFTALALLRSEATMQNLPQAFLQQAKVLARPFLPNSVELLGPVKAPMERKAGRFRAQLLIQAEDRADLQRFLDTWVEQISAVKIARRVRWAIDVDPTELL